MIWLYLFFNVALVIISIIHGWTAGHYRINAFTRVPTVPIHERSIKLLASRLGSTRLDAAVNPQSKVKRNTKCEKKKAESQLTSFAQNRTKNLFIIFKNLFQVKEVEIPKYPATKKIVEKMVKNHDWLHSFEVCVAAKRLDVADHLLNLILSPVQNDMQIDSSADWYYPSFQLKEQYKPITPKNIQNLKCFGDLIDLCFWRGNADLAANAVCVEHMLIEHTEKENMNSYPSYYKRFLLLITQYLDDIKENSNSKVSLSPRMLEFIDNWCLFLLRDPKLIDVDLFNFILKYIGKRPYRLMATLWISNMVKKLQPDQLFMYLDTVKALWGRSDLELSDEDRIFSLPLNEMLFWLLTISPSYEKLLENSTIWKTAGFSKNNGIDVLIEAFSLPCALNDLNVSIDSFNPASSCENFTMRYVIEKRVVKTVEILMHDYVVRHFQQSSKKPDRMCSKWKDLVHAITRFLTMGRKPNDATYLAEDRCIEILSLLKQFIQMVPLDIKNNQLLNYLEALDDITLAHVACIRKTEPLKSYIRDIFKFINNSLADVVTANHFLQPLLIHMPRLFVVRAMLHCFELLVGHSPSNFVEAFANIDLKGVFGGISRSDNLLDVLGVVPYFLLLQSAYVLEFDATLYPTIIFLNCFDQLLAVEAGPTSQSITLRMGSDEIKVTNCIGADAWRSFVLEYMVSESTNIILSIALTENDFDTINYIVARMMKAASAKKTAIESLISSTNINSIEHGWLHNTSPVTCNLLLSGLLIQFDELYRSLPMMESPSSIEKLSAKNVEVTSVHPHNVNVEDIKELEMALLQIVERMDRMGYHLSNYSQTLMNCILENSQASNLCLAKNPALKEALVGLSIKLGSKENDIEIEFSHTPCINRLDSIRPEDNIASLENLYVHFPVQKQVKKKSTRSVSSTSWEQSAGSLNYHKGNVESSRQKLFANDLLSFLVVKDIHMIAAQCTALSISRATTAVESYIAKYAIIT